jgi:hypothetical protein
MEFLWSVYGRDPLRVEPQNGQSDEETEVETKNKTAAPTKDNRDHVILIEIRNDPEPRAPRVPEKPPLGDVVEQVTSPITTLLGAWDVAQPTRNQREYRLLESAVRDRVKIDHIIFEFKTKKGEKDPLSWHLTTRDIEKINDVWKLYESSAARLAASFPSAPSADTSQY